MGFLSPLVSLVSGYMQARAISKLGSEAAAYADRWFRLMASVIITSYVVFPGLWGATTLSLWKLYGIWVALGAGFATALSVTPLVIYNLWVRDPLTKGISIALPSSLAQAAVNQDVTITTRS